MRGRAALLSIRLARHHSSVGTDIPPVGRARPGCARRLRPSCIVLDIVLPQLDGWDVLARAKQDPSIRDIPIVVVSMLDERGKGFALGAAEYIVKPISSDRLRETIHRLVHPRHPSAKILAVPSSRETSTLLTP